MSKEKEEESYSKFVDISCKTYDYEFKSCETFKSRLYQRYENGSKLDCKFLKDLITYKHFSTFLEDLSHHYLL